MEVLQYYSTTVEPLNNGHNRGREFCPLLRGCPFFGGRNVWTIYRQGGNSLSTEIVHSLECPLSEVLLYMDLLRRRGFDGSAGDRGGRDTAILIQETGGGRETGVGHGGSPR